MFATSRVMVRERIGEQMPKLATLSVRSAKAGRHADGEGLYLLVKPTGAKSWLLRVQVAIRGKYDKLAETLEYIEYSLGRYEKKTSRMRKVWHIEAIILCRDFRRALVAAGRNDVGETGSYTMAVVVSEALKLVGNWSVEPAAVNAHLVRWNRKYGLPR